MITLLDLRKCFNLYYQQKGPDCMVLYKQYLTTCKNKCDDM